MQLYRLDYDDKDEGTIVEWFSNYREGHTRKRELERDGTFIFSLDRLNLPVQKAAMIRWLNAHLNRDNG